MIDRRGRDQMAKVLRQFFGRQITNDDFDGAVEVHKSPDLVLKTIESLAWTLYDDHKTHYLDRETRSLAKDHVARWILFLQTDFEYRWPKGPYDGFPTISLLRNLLTLGWWERRKARLAAEWERHGDVSIWPFLDRAEMEAARTQPRFLVGRRGTTDQPNPV